MLTRLLTPNLTSTLRLIVLFVATVFTMGCSIGYRNHHESDLLTVYRSDASSSQIDADEQDLGAESAGSRRNLRSSARPDNRKNPGVNDIDPAWATGVLRIYERDFGVALEDVVPVRVYINCDEESDEKSHFNRLTHSIVLKVGQADLPRIYVHEVSHLFLNAVESFPPYWIDQGLAEYMESRYVGSPMNPWAELVPPGLDWSELVVRRIGSREGEDEFEGTGKPGAPASSILKERLTREVIDEGRGLSVPFIHYLFAHRWREVSMAHKIRLLLELDEQDLEVLAPIFLEYCRHFNPVEEILGSN